MDSHRDIRSGEAGPTSMSLRRLACRTAFHELGNGGVYCIAIWPAWGYIIASQEVYSEILIDAGEHLNTCLPGRELNINQNPRISRKQKGRSVCFYGLPWNADTLESPRCFQPSIRESLCHHRRMSCHIQVSYLSIHPSSHVSHNPTKTNATSQPTHPFLHR